MIRASDLGSNNILYNSVYKRRKSLYTIVYGEYNYHDRRTESAIKTIHTLGPYQLPRIITRA